MAAEVPEIFRNLLEPAKAELGVDPWRRAAGRCSAATVPAVRVLAQQNENQEEKYLAQRRKGAKLKRTKRGEFSCSLVLFVRLCASSALPPSMNRRRGSTSASVSVKVIRIAALLHSRIGLAVTLITLVIAAVALLSGRGFGFRRRYWPTLACPIRTTK